MKPLTAENLKQKLWETLHLVQSKNIDTKRANAVTTAAREICRVVKTQIESIKVAKINPKHEGQLLLK